MKTITIQTTHNVNIEYELASVWERILAFFIDLSILSVYLGIITVPFAILLSASEEAGWLFYAIFFVPVFFFYNFFCELFWGAQSIGKKALKLKVIKNNGANLKLADYTMRWIFRLIDIMFSAGAVAVISILSSEHNQRLGDVLGDTSVIKLKPKNQLLAKDIMAIKDLSKYQPRYPQVVNFSEEDMLLLKNALDRSKANPNEHYRKLLITLTENISKELELKEIPAKRTQFLKTVLNDYIVLTR